MGNLPSYNQIRPLLLTYECVAHCITIALDVSLIKWAIPD